MPPKTRKNRHTRITRKVIPKDKKVAKLSAPVKNAVRAVAQRAVHVETKQVCSTLENLVGHNSTIYVGDQYPVIPQVSVGELDFQRTGMKINPTGLYISGRLAMAGGIQGNNKAIYARVLVISQKNIKDSTQLSSWSPSNLLRANDSSTGANNLAFDGTTRNALYPINEELFTVHYKKDIKLTPSIDTGSGDRSVEMNDRTSARFGCKVSLPKTLEYNSGSAVYPVNSAPFLAIGYYYCDGTAPDGVSGPFRLTSTVVSTMYYKDA